MIADSTKMIFLIGIFNLLPAAVFAQTTDPDQATWSPEIISQLKRAGDNRPELVKALQEVDDEHLRGMRFLIENMGQSDLRSLRGDYLLENVALAYRAIEAVPWGNTIPEPIFFNDVLPYANLDETREDWRKEMLERCMPIIKNCKTPGQAAQKLNRELFPLINVKYGTSRKRANQSPAQSIQQSVASCTGLSILLSDACRSVGVPARLAGIPSWTNKNGNHTWVEIWDGQWHFTGAAEPSNQGLDHAWFVHDASLADNQLAMHRIYAASFQRTDTLFPLVWSPGQKEVFAVNVTPRYTAASPQSNDQITRVMLRITSNRQRIVKQVSVANISDGDDRHQGASRGPTADLNDFLTFELKRGATYKISIGDRSFERTTGTAAQQMWEFAID